MADLIDRQSVIDLLKKSASRDIEEVVVTEKNIKLIMDMPTAYDVEKVVAELEQQAEQYRNRGFEHEQFGCSLSADKYYGKQCSYLHAIDIVKRGGVE